MESKSTTMDELLAELEEVRRQLYESNEIIEAIRTGQVDALVVQNGGEHQLYTLKSADHAYRVFIEKMIEGAITLNKDGIILYANSQFAAMVRLPLSAVIGFPFQNFIDQAYTTFYANLFETGWKEECKGEVLLSYNGVIMPVQLSLTSLELHDGHTLSIIITDLSLQKATQKQLQENNRQLETLNKTLEESNHDLQQFAFVASHDLQEPLRKIQMFTHLMMQRSGDRLIEEDLQYLNKVLNAAGRMKALIMDVLDYSRLSANIDEFVVTDLNQILQASLEDFELVIDEKNAILQCDPLPEIEVNPGQMAQVFQNFISNSLKFAKEGRTPHIHISAKRLAHKNFDSEVMDDGPYCLITVKDNGIGFEEKYIPNIFSLFERLHPKDQYEGTGIGLAITKKIIEKHHGLIRVRSKVDAGAEFSILLPVRQGSR